MHLFNAETFARLSFHIAYKDKPKWWANGLFDVFQRDYEIDSYDSVPQAAVFLMTFDAKVGNTALDLINPKY